MFWGCKVTNLYFISKIISCLFRDSFTRSHPQIFEELTAIFLSGLQRYNCLTYQQKIPYSFSSFSQPLLSRNFPLIFQGGRQMYSYSSLHSNFFSTLSTFYLAFHIYTLTPSIFLISVANNLSKNFFITTLFFNRVAKIALHNSSPNIF